MTVGTARIDAFEFEFRVNNSFLHTSSHPITIRAQHNNIVQRHLAGAHLDLVVCAGSRRLDARLYRGLPRPSGGLYYQLRMNNHEFSRLPSEFIDAHAIQIRVEFRDEICTVYLEADPDNNRQRSP